MRLMVSRRSLVCVGVSLDMEHQNIKLFVKGGGEVGGPEVTMKCHKRLSIR